MKTMMTTSTKVASSLLLLLSIIITSHCSSSVAAATTTKQTKKINRCPLRPSHNNIIRPPLILGHRGASYHIPEHTLPSYRLALELGADYIEPDLVATKDNVLVALHSIDLNVTTDVHTFNNGQYHHRARYKTVNNNEQFGYYVNDFTYDEIQQFTVIQRIHNTGTRYTGYDNLFKIPSFTQIVNLLHDWNTRVAPLIGRPNKVGGVAGMYVELKQSYYFEQNNVSLPDLFLDELANHPLASELLFDHVTCDNLHYDEYRVPPLVVQAFEGDVLEYLRKKFKERWMDFVMEDAILEAGVVNNMEEGGEGEGGEGNGDDEEIDEIDHPWIPPLVLLVRESDCYKETFWFEVESLHISGLGPSKNCLLPSSTMITSNDTVGIDRAKHEAREWVAKAHSLRLAVHPWTIRLEKEVYGHVGGVPQLFSSVEEELRYYYCDLSIDGIFTENIAIAQIVGAQGCDANDDSTTKTTTPTVGGGEPAVCIKEERNLWLFGLALLSIGVFFGSIMSAYTVFYCKKETNGNNRPLPVPTEVHTSLELEEEEDNII